MPLSGYGVLVGAVVDRRREGGTSSPHFQIHVRAGNADHRLAVNVLSQQAPSDLLFLTIDPFVHPIIDLVTGLPDGFSPLASQAQSGALDFVRGNLFDPTQMRPLPPDVPGPDNDLADRLDHLVARAVADPAARVFAFGQRWGPDATPDPVFGFRPGSGVHDIHMNQGNSGSFVGDDGVWQDGGLLFRFPTGSGSPEWSAVFLAFQSQSWHTDDGTGHTIPGPGPSTTSALRVVAALAHPAGPAPERETVTVLNAGPVPLDLAGWSLADAAKNRSPLAGTVAAGVAVAVPVSAPFGLGNSGGAITLLDPHGLKVDGVSYTAAQAAEEGWTIVFR